MEIINQLVVNRFHLKRKHSFKQAMYQLQKPLQNILKTKFKKQPKNNKSKNQQYRLKHKTSVELLKSITIQMAMMIPNQMMKSKLRTIMKLQNNNNLKKTHNNKTKLSLNKLTPKLHKQRNNKCQKAQQPKRPARNPKKRDQAKTLNPKSNRKRRSWTNKSYPPTWQTSRVTKCITNNTGCTLRNKHKQKSSGSSRRNKSKEKKDNSRPSWSNKKAKGSRYNYNSRKASRNHQPLIITNKNPLPPLTYSPNSPHNPPPTETSKPLSLYKTTTTTSSSSNKETTSRKSKPRTTPTALARKPPKSPNPP